MKNYKITVLKGDGIGPEIVDECVKVLDKACLLYTSSCNRGAADGFCIGCFS